MWRFLLVCVWWAAGLPLLAQSSGQAVDNGLAAAQPPVSAQLQAFEAKAELQIHDLLDALRWLGDPGPDPQMKEALEAHVLGLFLPGARWQEIPLKKWLQNPDPLPESSPAMAWQGHWQPDKRGGQTRELSLSWAEPAPAVSLLVFVQLLPQPKSYGAEQLEVWEVKIAGVK